MTFKSEFNIDDTVFFIYEGKIATSKVHAIEMTHYQKEGTEFKYKVNLNNRTNGLTSEVFKDKAELIKHLLE